MVERVRVRGVRRLLLVAAFVLTGLMLSACGSASPTVTGIGHPNTAEISACTVIVAGSNFESLSVSLQKAQAGAVVHFAANSGDSALKSQAAVLQKDVSQGSGAGTNTVFASLTQTCSNLGMSASNSRSSSGSS
jgi:hypothetical protein